MLTVLREYGKYTKKEIKRNVLQIQCLLFSIVIYNNTSNVFNILLYLLQGSNSYRWFHDGCCECVGANCYNYGINESRCTLCPDDNEDDEEFNNTAAGYAGEDDNNMSWDYGEDDENYN